MKTKQESKHIFTFDDPDGAWCPYCKAQVKPNENLNGAIHLDDFAWKNRIDPKFTRTPVSNEEKPKRESKHPVDANKKVGHTPTPWTPPAYDISHDLPKSWEKKITPLPWVKELTTFENGKRKVWFIRNKSDFIAELKEQYIPVANQTHEETAKANAEFIVRAVNAHEELIRAAKRGIAALIANDAPNCEAVKELKAAIAHAEGGK